MNGDTVILISNLICKIMDEISMRAMFVLIGIFLGILLVQKANQ